MLAISNISGFTFYSTISGGLPYLTFLSAFVTPCAAAAITYALRPVPSTTLPLDGFAVSESIYL